MPMATKPGMMVTYFKVILHIVSHYISTITMSIVAKLGSMVTYHEGLPPVKSHEPLIKAKSHDKLRPLYFTSVYGHQNWQGGNLP